MTRIDWTWIAAVRRELRSRESGRVGRGVAPFAIGVIAGAITMIAMLLFP